MDEILKQFAIYFPEINNALSVGIMIFLRLVGMMRLAPVLSKSEIPAMVRLSFALISTVIMVGILNPAPAPEGTPIFLCMLLNFIYSHILVNITNSTAFTCCCCSVCYP